jgi:hypothetical protein
MNQPDDFNHQTCWQTACFVEILYWQCRFEWIPPPHLDTGQARTNDYHHPENLLGGDDESDD